MNNKIIVGVLLACVSGSVFSEPLQEDSQPISLKLSDNSLKEVNTCEDFIALRRAGKTVTDLPNLPDRFTDMARGSLTNCYLTTYAKDHGLTEIKPASQAPTLKEIVDHFPASAAIAISNEEVAKVKSLYQNKTIRQKEPDLKPDNNGRMVSTKSADGYLISNHRTFKDKDGKIIDFITLGKFVTQGTWGESTTYEILSKSNPVWTIQEINENSPL
ncbi:MULTISPECIES: hypothetical protein [Rahnella]|jgi:hypothetical protein|uniref:hypothetical protein n=1 Tax=Rahnella TaxID=34037 RepID=UPI0010477448|nr:MULTISPECIES: hypothetical protein [Rahnella]TCQ87579.1 hypothetical protein EC840_106290 [Rahnella sp. JUb53]